MRECDSSLESRNELGVFGVQENADRGSSRFAIRSRIGFCESDTGGPRVEDLDPQIEGT
jgi:hypothetical protein